MHKEKAEKFQKENSAYVHTEMKDCKSPETIICGDFIAMLFCIEAEINRLSELTNTTFEQTLSVLAMNHKIGKDNVIDLTKGFDKKKVKGSFEIMREEVEKELKRNDDKLEKSIEELKKELKSEKEATKMQKVKKEKAEKEHFREKEKLQKEILRLEHENEKLSRMLAFGKEK